MSFTILATLALGAAAPSAIDRSPQVIGCHPHPGKVMGCVTSSHVVAQQRAKGIVPVVQARADDSTARRMIACHPDPSRNRGCYRAVPDRPDDTGADGRPAALPVPIEK
jgi:hypothetical protein